MKKPLSANKKLIRIRFYWYSLLTSLFGSTHFSKYKLKYGALLLTLTMAGCGSGTTGNTKDNPSSTQNGPDVVSDSVPEQSQITCYEPAAPPDTTPPPKFVPPKIIEIDPGKEPQVEVTCYVVSVEPTCYDVAVVPKDTIAVEPKNKIYDYAEVMPQFPGGTNDLFQFLRDNLIYPEDAIDNGIQGTVVVKLVVSETGHISDMKILRSLHPSCDKEAIRLIKSMPDWIPAKQNGKEVSVYYTMPVRFKLMGLQ